MAAIRNLIAQIEAGQRASVNLAGVSVPPSTMRELFLALQRNRSVTSLNLSCTGFSNLALPDLCDLLKATSTLRKLYFEGNKLDDRGMALLAEGLAKNSTIQILNLKWNDIQPEGAKSLAIALSNNTALKELYLDNNSIGDMGADALLKSFSGHLNLHTVSVYDNGLSREAVLSFTQARLQWSVQSHAFQSAGFRRTVRLLMTINRWATESVLHVLPNELMFLLFGELTGAWWPRDPSDDFQPVLPEPEPAPSLPAPAPAPAPRQPAPVAPRAKPAPSQESGSSMSDSLGSSTGERKKKCIIS